MMHDVPSLLGRGKAPKQPQRLQAWLGSALNSTRGVPIYPDQKALLQLSHPLPASLSSPVVLAGSKLSATRASCLWLPESSRSRRGAELTQEGKMQGR